MQLPNCSVLMNITCAGVFGVRQMLTKREATEAQNLAARLWNLCILFQRRRKSSSAILTSKIFIASTSWCPSVRLIVCCLQNKSIQRSNYSEAALQTLIKFYATTCSFAIDQNSIEVAEKCMTAAFQVTGVNFPKEAQRAQIWDKMNNEFPNPSDLDETQRNEAHLQLCMRRAQLVTYHAVAYKHSTLIFVSCGEQGSEVGIFDGASVIYFTKRWQSIFLQEPKNASVINPKRSEWKKGPLWFTWQAMGLANLAYSFGVTCHKDKQYSEAVKL